MDAKKITGSRVKVTYATHRRQIKILLRWLGEDVEQHRQCQESYGGPDWTAVGQLRDVEKRLRRAYAYLAEQGNEDIEARMDAELQKPEGPVVSQEGAESCVEICRKIMMVDANCYRLTPKWRRAMEDLVGQADAALAKAEGRA